MELSPCLLLLLLFCSTYSNKIIEDDHQGPMLPRFTWLDNHNIMVSFPNGVVDTIKLRAADKIGNMIVPCLYEGVLLQDNSSSVAVSGCRHDDLVHIFLNTNNLPYYNMFNINNGTTEEVEKIDFDKSNTRVGRKNKRRLKKRGAYLDDDDDYDEEAFDGSDPPTPPPFLSLQVRFAFEESLLAEKKTEVAAREYIARVFTLGKHHFQHTSLGTKIRLNAQGPIRRIHDKSWNPSSVDLRESRKYKDPENIPITFFCYNQDRENDVGIAYLRRACHEEKGVAIVAARDDINKAAQSYSHETAHWLGLPHDADISVECEGQGIMSRIDTPGGRPSKWSYCNERQFNKWFYYDNKKFSKCLKDDEEILQMESSCLATSYETVVTSTPKCDIVEVSGADYANCNGEYQVSVERVPWSPSRPVYAHVSEDRYIYWNVRGHGWSIGNKADLRTGAYFHYSGLDSSEPWEAPWRNNITVQCKLGCDVGEMYDGNCYLLVSTPATWQDAQLDCTSRNGSLASIHNAGTNDFISSLTGGGGSDTWIGASDAETEGEWKWTDGNIATFSNWRRGEPNNVGGNQNCLIINFHETGKWDDNRCDKLFPYVCQGQKLSKGCDSGWKHDGGDKCYKVFPEVLTAYVDASDKCISVQAQVAALETPEENKFIQWLLDQEQLPSGRDLWLSGRRQSEDSPYVWGTGEEMVYNDWRGGQPQERSELCMCIYRNGNPTWQWDTQPCVTSNYPDNGVLCEKTAN